MRIKRFASFNEAFKYANNRVGGFMIEKFGSQFFVTLY
jgi:hypothetical protein